MKQTQPKWENSVFMIVVIILLVLPEQTNQSKKLRNEFPLSKCASTNANNDSFS